MRATLESTRARVIAGGGSSDASIAAFAAYNITFEPDDEDRSISHEPNALVLLNPAFGCPSGQSSQGAPCAVMASWKVTKRGQPTILFYGTEDPLQDGGRDVTRQLIAAGTRAEFYNGQGPTARLLESLPRFAMARTRPSTD